VVPDRIEAMIGVERDFAGLGARWAAWLDITDREHRSDDRAGGPFSNYRP
jgi:hypothetical protein